MPDVPKADWSERYDIAAIRGERYKNSALTYDCVETFSPANNAAWLLVRLGTVLTALIADAYMPLDVHRWADRLSEPTAEQVARLDAAVRTFWVIDEIVGEDVARETMTRSFVCVSQGTRQWMTSPAVLIQLGDFDALRTAIDEFVESNGGVVV